MTCRSFSWVLLLVAVACSFFYVATLHRGDPGIEKIIKGNFWSFQFIEGKATGYEARPIDEQEEKPASEVRIAAEETVVVLMARAENDTSVSFSSDFTSFDVSTSSLDTGFSSFSSDPTTSSFESLTSVSPSSSSSSFAQRTSSRESFSSSSPNSDAASSSQRTTTRQQASSSGDTTSSATEQDSATSAPETTGSSSASDQITTTFSSVDNGKTVVVTKTIDSQGTNQPSAASGDRNKNSSGSSGLSDTNKIVVGVVVGVGGAIIVGIISILFLLKRRSNKNQEGGWTFWRKNEKGDDSDLLSGELGVRDRNINQGSNF
ncbi:Cell-surface associated glycoprotein DFI1 [Meyerozyma sp. JA9]|nr:Cell-surface associated glycoprotein DFI1 [Meyerozyma sp. JA9]